MNLFKKHHCYNGGNEHNFNPRYSEKPNKIDLSGPIGDRDLRSLLFYKVYECDVCVWCGKVIYKDVEEE